jgi:hypothetical protein
VSERSESSRRTCTGERHLTRMRTHHDLYVSCGSSILRIFSKPVGLFSDESAPLQALSGKERAEGEDKAVERHRHHLGCSANKA